MDKTQLAASVAQAAGTHIERLQCCRGVTEDKAIGRFDESLQRLYMEFSKGQNESGRELRANLKGRDFFRPGPLMRALECEKPCVLLIDELDRVDEGFRSATVPPAELLANLIAIPCIANWRIFWITMLSRSDPEASSNDAFAQLDQYPLIEFLPDMTAASPPKPSLAHYIVKLARLGGYLASAHDPPPDNAEIRKGLSRLTGIELGIMIGVQLVVH